MYQLHSLDVRYKVKTYLWCLCGKLNHCQNTTIKGRSNVFANRLFRLPLFCVQNVRVRTLPLLNPRAAMFRRELQTLLNRSEDLSRLHMTFSRNEEFHDREDHTSAYASIMPRTFEERWIDHNRPLSTL